MSKFTIKSQEAFNDCLLWISDLSKDAYGFRVRNRDWAAMSWEELADEVNGFQAYIQYEEEALQAQDRAMAEEYEMGILRCMEAGASDRETAARWLEQSEEWSRGEWMYVDSMYLEANNKWGAEWV